MTPQATTWEDVYNSKVAGDPALELGIYLDTIIAYTCANCLSNLASQYNIRLVTHEPLKPLNPQMFTTLCTPRIHFNAFQSTSGWRYRCGGGRVTIIYA